MHDSEGDMTRDIPPAAAAEMPRYQCHKKVWALKIRAVTGGNGPDGSAMITPDDHGYAAFGVDSEYIRKHNPRAGGYYVVYDDGYASYSPARAFEDGYSRL